MKSLKKSRSCLICRCFSNKEVPRSEILVSGLGKTLRANLDKTNSFFKGDNSASRENPTSSDFQEGTFKEKSRSRRKKKKKVQLETIQRYK